MRITVFTPTYNRAYIIGKLYESLQNQTFHDFEWLVIDDGSTDNTKKLFDKWKKEKNLFKIRYIYSENRGKQKEINTALKIAKGTLFLTVDSDDLLTSDALEKIDMWEQKMPHDKKFCGLAGSDGDMNGIHTNPIFSEEYQDVTFLNRYPEMGNFIGYDRPWVFYTEIHRRYLYPEIQGENFITEAVAWNRMARDGYKIRCYNDIIYIWEHQSHGLTNNITETLRKNPIGYGIWKKELIELLNYNKKQKFLCIYSFYCDLREYYSWYEIADFLDVSRFQMFIIHMLFLAKHLWR